MTNVRMLCCFFLLATVSGLASADDSTVLFVEDFTNGDALKDWKSPQALCWSVDDGVLRTTNTTDRPAIGTRSSKFAGTPAMRMSMRFNPLDAKNIVFKLNHTSGGHVWRVIMTPQGFSGIVNRNKAIPITETVLLGKVDAQIAANTWHTLVIEQRGDVAEVTVAGVKAKFQNEHLRHPLATFGLSVRGEAALFDDIRIESLPEVAAEPKTVVRKRQKASVPAVAQPKPRPVFSPVDLVDNVSEPTDWSGIQGHLASACADCHMGGATEGNLDLDALPTDLSDAETRRRWVVLFDRVHDGEMPPSDAEPFGDGDRERLLASLGVAIHRADAAEQEVVLRRLNRVEYENTVNDLFGIDVEVAADFPADATRDGFDNNGEALSMSAELVETYLTTADRVLDSVLGTAERPESVSVDTEVRDLVHHNMYDKWYKLLDIDGGTVIYSSNYGAGSQLNLFKAPSDGRYRVRLTASAYQSEEPVLMQVQAGVLTRSGSKRLVGFFDVPPEGRVVEFVEPFRTGDSIYPRPYGLLGNISNFLQRDYRREKLLKYDGRGLKIDRVEIEGPIDEWPPASRGRLLGTVDAGMAKANDAREIFARLLPRAFRRPVAPDELSNYMEKVAALMNEGRSFEEALRWTLRAMLCSAEFLFIEEPADQNNEIDDFALASRLSYFLWSSMPDKELFDLARNGELSDPATLRQQTERMLANPRSQSLVTNFAEQWLDLREIDATSPDTKLYPDFDEYLQHSMVAETRAFVETVLRENLSVREFIDSDWVTVNERLAKHYGLNDRADKLGVDVEKLSLPDDSVRGGLMTQASILKITANGANTSPVIRGVWMLENLMGIHPPPPPPNIPAVVPDVSGANTLRELLAAHRGDVSCDSCHRKIDPPGFALEEFDAVGGWRDSYQFQGSRKLLPVDSSGQTPRGESFNNVRDYKRLLLGEIDQVTAGLADKLLTYGTGRSMGFSDRGDIDAIVASIADSGYRFGDLIHAVVASPAFRKP